MSPSVPEASLESAKGASTAHRRWTHSNIHGPRRGQQISVVDSPVLRLTASAIYSPITWVQENTKSPSASAGWLAGRFQKGTPREKKVKFSGKFMQ